MDGTADSIQTDGSLTVRRDDGTVFGVRAGDVIHVR
jgi:quercetin dioxygenase-like cupin family protein